MMQSRLKYGLLTLAVFALIIICLLQTWSGARYRRWVYQATDGVDNIAVINRASLVIITTPGGEVTALDQNNGQVQWLWHGGPLLHLLASPEGTVFIQGEGGEIDALDGTTGKTRWKYHPTEKNTTLALGPDRTLRVASSHVYTLDEETGKVKSVNLQYSGTEKGLSIAPDYTTLTAIDKANGKTKWHFDLGKYIYSFPMVGNDQTIYVGSMEGYVFALGAKDGALKWETRMNAKVTTPPVVGLNQTLIVGAGIDQFCILDTRNGTIKVNVHLGSQLDRLNPIANAYCAIGMTSPVIGSDGTIFMGSATGKVYALRYP